MKLTEAQLESAFIELLGVEGYPRVLGEAIERHPRRTTLPLSILAQRRKDAEELRRPINDKDGG